VRAPKDKVVDVELTQEELPGDIKDHLEPYENESAIHFDTRSRIAQQLSDDGVGNRESLTVSRLITEKLLTGITYSVDVEKYISEFRA